MAVSRVHTVHGFNWEVNGVGSVRFQGENGTISCTHMRRMGLGIFFTYMNGINSMVNVGNILQSHGAYVGRYWGGLGDGWVEWEFIWKRAKANIFGLKVG